MYLDIFVFVDAFCPELLRLSKPHTGTITVYVMALNLACQWLQTDSRISFKLSTMTWRPCSAVGSELRIRLSTGARHISANERRRTTWKHSNPTHTRRTVAYHKGGSVLGPLKFVSYTEDSADLITSYRLGYHLYADVTTLNWLAVQRSPTCHAPSTVFSDVWLLL